MKKNFTLTTLCSLLTAAAFAQTPTIANGDFESWTTEEGYSTTATIFTTTMNFNVFDAYQHPTSWGRPTYDVNTSINVAFATAEIHTTVPIHLFEQDTRNAGKVAVLRSFKINDIVTDELVLAAAASGLEELGITTETICASLLYTASANPENLFQLGLLGCGGTTIDAIINTLKTADMSDYFTNGISTTGFKAGSVKGTYKYVQGDAELADAGYILLLGIHNNTLVGAGVSAPLTASTYTDVEVDYTCFDGATAADQLVVVIMSSGVSNCAQGSKLYVDNLSINQDNSSVEEMTSQMAIVQPNPCRGSVMCQVNGLATVSIYTTTGRLVSQEEVAEQATLTFPGAGTYVVQIQQGNAIQQEKIVVLP